MPESTLYSKPRLDPKDVRLEDLIGVAHPSGGTSDDMAMRVIDLFRAGGFGTQVDHYAAKVARVAVAHQTYMGYFDLDPLVAPPAEEQRLTWREVSTREEAPPWVEAGVVRVNELKTAIVKHAESVGTKDQDGAHQAADATGAEIAALPDCTKEDVFDLLMQLGAWFQVHGTTTVNADDPEALHCHFHDDPTTIAFTWPPMDEPTGATFYALINALHGALLTHARNAVSNA